MIWMPIETAPRDGTPVLVWDGTAMSVAYYSLIVKQWIDQNPTGWPEYGLKLWHPLPDPPTVSQPLTVPPVVKDSLTPAIPLDDDLDEPLGPACSRENPECESCT